MCPHCGREAPLLYRGALAYCSACNGPRVPLSATSVNMAGKPAKLGGTVASVVGWVVLAVMLAIALILGAILQAVFPPGAVVGWAVGGVVAAIGVAAAMLLLMGGKFLQRTGDKAAVGAKRDAVFALAQNQKGILRVPVAAKALAVTPQEAEAFLTELSRDPDSGVTLEVDSDGKLYFRFNAFAFEAPWPPPGTSLTPATAPSPGGQAGVRVQRTEPLRAPAGRTELAEPLQDDADEETADGTKRARQLL